MTVLRHYESPDGESHMEDIDVALTPSTHGKALMPKSPVFPAKEAFFIAMPEHEGNPDPHVSPSRALVVMVRGERYHKTSDGDVRHIRQGDVLLLEDTVGKGHAVMNKKGAQLLLYLPLDD
jgi:hypothetical protein